MSTTEENARPPKVEDIEAKRAEIAATALARGWDDPHTPDDVAVYMDAELYGKPPGFPVQDRTCEELQRMHRYLSKLGTYYDECDDELAERTAPTLLAAAQAAKLLVSEELRDALHGIIAASWCPFGSPEYEQYMQRLQETDHRFTAELQAERHRFLEEARNGNSRMSSPTPIRVGKRQKGIRFPLPDRPIWLGRAAREGHHR